VAPLAGIVVAFATASQTLFHLSDAIAKAWAWIPGTKFANDAIDSVRGMRPEDVDAIRFVAEAGVWVVAAAIAASAAFSLLAPPERPRPWVRGGRATSAIRYVLEAVPYVVAAPVLAFVVYGAWKFASGSTFTALDVGAKLLVGAAVVGFVGLGLVLIAGRQAARATGLRYAIYVLLMVTFMVLVCGLVAAPVVAAVVFPDVGRVVVGSLAIVVAFQAIARVGGWRWAVWDARERAAARTGSPYHATGRVFTQIVLLLVIVTAAFLSVVLDSVVAAAVAGVAIATLVLVGVAIDVLDAVRQEVESPPDSIRRYQLRA